MAIERIGIGMEYCKRCPLANGEAYKYLRVKFQNDKRVVQQVVPDSVNVTIQCRSSGLFGFGFGVTMQVAKTGTTADGRTVEVAKNQDVTGKCPIRQASGNLWPLVKLEPQ